MGYYAHLIAADIWLKGFYLSWLRNRMDADEGTHKLYHNDFRLLNGKLLKYYGFTDELRRILSGHVPEIIELEEIKSRDVENFIPYIMGDLEYQKECLEEKLNIFTFNQIVGYIETSVELGLLNIKYNQSLEYI